MKKKGSQKKGAGIFLALTISLFLVLFLSCGAQKGRSQKETRKRTFLPPEAKPSRENRKRTPKITLEKRNSVVCSAENTFMVSTCQDLMNMKNNLAACYVLSNDIVNNTFFSFLLLVVQKIPSKEGFFCI